MAKLLAAYPSIQDGAGVCSGHWADGGSCLSSFSPSWHMPPSPALPMLHNFNIVFLLRLICMLSIHNGCHTQFTKPSPLHCFSWLSNEARNFSLVHCYWHYRTLCIVGICDLCKECRKSYICKFSCQSSHVLFILLSKYLILDIGLT